jgi:hypothetical protein
MERGRLERLHEFATLIAWQTHQLVGAQADESWLQKFGAFRDYVAFFRPPFVIAEDEDQ